MTEADIILKAIKRDNRSAYRKAKENDCAYVINGKTIYRFDSDGTKTPIKRIDSGLIKTENRIIDLGSF